MESLKQVFRLDQSKIDDLFNQLDLFNNKTINWQEFVAAAMGKSVLLQESNLRQAFKLIDKAGDNYICKQEIIDAFSDKQFGNENSEQIWQEFVAELNI